MWKTFSNLWKTSDLPVETLWNVEGKVREKIRIAKGINGSWVMGHGSWVNGVFRHFRPYNAIELAPPTRQYSLSQKDEVHKA
jgi:hypothetical protein